MHGWLKTISIVIIVGRLNWSRFNDEDLQLVGYEVLA